MEKHRYFIVLFILFFILIITNSECSAKNYGYFDSQSDTFKKYFSEANEYTDKKQFDKAIKYYEEALKENPKQMQALGELCYCYSQLENYNKMIEIGQKGLLIAQQLDNKDNIGRFYGYIGNAYKMLEKYNEAIRYLHLAIYNKYYYYDNYLSLAYCYFKTKHYDSAINQYNTLKNLDPEYYEKNNLEKSRDIILREALVNDEAFKHLDLGAKYKAEKNYEAAIKEYKAILQKEPDDLTSLMELIQNEVLNKTENIQELQETCNKLIKLLDKKENSDFYNYYETAYKGIGYCLKKQKDAKLLAQYKKLMESFSFLKKAKNEVYKDDNKAISDFKTAIEKISDLEDAPYNYSAINDLIELLFRLNKYEDAKKYISIAINQAKKDKDKNKLAKYSKDIATYYSLKNEYKKAIEFYQKGLDMTSDDDDKFKFYVGIAISHSILGEREEELKNYEKAKEQLSGDSVEMITDIDSSIVKCKSLLDKNSDLSKGLQHFENGQELYLKGKTNDALEEYSESLKYLPQRLETLYHLSKCLYLTENKQEAYKVNEEGFVVALRDRETFYLDYFSFMSGNRYYDNKEYDKAIFYFEHISDYNPTFKHKDVLFLIGVCNLLQHKIKEALAYFEESYKLDPDNEDLAKQIAKCKEMLKEQ